MSSSTVDRSDERADGTLPLQWEWEKWQVGKPLYCASTLRVPCEYPLEYRVRRQVVDARNGLVALWSPTWKRFLRMNDKTGNAALDFSDARADGVLPEGWEWERFQLVPGPSGTVALWSPTWRRFARMDESRLSRSDVAADATLPAAWAWEAFKVTTLSSPVADEAQARFCPSPSILPATRTHGRAPCAHRRPTARGLRHAARASRGPRPPRCMLRPLPTARVRTRTTRPRPQPRAATAGAHQGVHRCAARRRCGRARARRERAQGGDRRAHRRLRRGQVLPPRRCAPPPRPLPGTRVRCSVHTQEASGG